MKSVREPVEQRRRHPGVTEDIGSFTEAERNQRAADGLVVILVA